MAEVGTPRNTIIGHSVGVAAGLLSLAIFGLLSAPSVYVSGVGLNRVGAIALAVALTGGVLRLLRSAHPPAGATTIIVASGLLAKPHQLLDILIGVLLLTIAGWLLTARWACRRPSGRRRAEAGLTRRWRWRRNRYMRHAGDSE